MRVVEVLWEEKFSMPIYVLENGRKFRPDTGSYAGYHVEVEGHSFNQDQPTIPRFVKEIREVMEVDFPFHSQKFDNIISIVVAEIERVRKEYAKEDNEERTNN